jgi:hypothetical protein
VLVHPERNGFMYVLDRETGEVLSAEPFGFTNTASGVDLKTGRLQPVKAKEPVTGKVVREICPAQPVAKDWQPSAYSPVCWTCLTRTSVRISKHSTSATSRERHTWVVSRSTIATARHDAALGFLDAVSKPWDIGTYHIIEGRVGSPRGFDVFLSGRRIKRRFRFENGGSTWRVNPVDGSRGRREISTRAVRATAARRHR